MEQNTARRLILGSLKYAVEQSGVSKNEVQIISEKILKEDLS